MTEVYAFEHCPFRNAAHAVADRSSIVRHAAHALWPAARRAERVEISDDGIDAWTLTGQTHLAWDDVTDVHSERTLLGRQTLRIDGSAGHIHVAPVLPGYDELERRVRAGCGSALVAA
jgi:Bacterial PH domain